MHDIRFIRETPEAFDAGLKKRGLAPLSQTLEAHVTPHPPQDFAGERAHARPEFHDHPRAPPFDGRQHLVDQEAGARNDGPEHVGMAQEVARKEQNCRSPRRGIL